MINEFFLHEQLCALEGIARQYPAGQACGGKIRETSDQIVSQIYRVAVIGEFKKGKSSLINALLGTEVLPTDILPMTAAINRVIYGDKKRITVHYKNGEAEERTVEELLDFGTKYDARREGVAKTVREIVVHYPSVFCKNHIELIDTPGLNDSEFMTEVTMSILGDVDTAIFVTSAREPLSMTEQDSILMLIGQPGIRHIIFVITCIDAFSVGEEQDRIIETIRQRLCENTMDTAAARYGDNPALLEKAQRILSRPDLYAVSSLLAMKGFVRDNEELLEESRFPNFKNSLLDYLTAAQSADMVDKTMDAAEEVSCRLDDWYQTAADELDRERERLETASQARNIYLRIAQARLNQLFQKMDAALEKRGIGADMSFSNGDLQTVGQKRFVVRLSSLRAGMDTHQNILVMLRRACEETVDTYSGSCRSIQYWIQEEMEQVEEAVSTIRQSAGFSQEPLQGNLEQWRRQVEFPGFAWIKDPVPAVPDLATVDIMPQVKSAIQASLNHLGRQINQYISSWRVVLIRQIQEDIRTAGREKTIEEQLSQTQMRRNMLQLSYEHHKHQVEEIRNELRSTNGWETTGG